MSGSTVKLNKRVFQDLDTDRMAPSDRRPALLARARIVDAEVMAAVQEVFACTPLLEDEQRVGALLAARAEINGAWGVAAKGFVMVGKRLRELDRLLSTEEREALKEGTERLFPFSKSVASKLRAVAKAVDEGVFSLEACPASYSAAYEITLLEPPLFEEARQRGLVSPRATRASLVAFRKERAVHETQRLDMAGLLAERRRSREQLAALEQRRQVLEARLAEIDRITQAVQDG